MNKNSNTAIIALVAIAVVGVFTFAILTMPDQRTPAEKVGDAISELPNGVDNAARELKDRTPAERMSDAVKDAAD